MSSTRQPRGGSGSWQSVRERVLDRDGHACRFCGMSNEEHKEEHEQGLHAHHVLPRKDGGEDHPGNLITVCTSCHRTIESAHAEAVEHAVSDKKVTTDYGKNAWELREYWTSSANKLIDEAADYAKRHPSLRNALGVHVPSDTAGGEIVVYNTVAETLVGKGSVDINSEHYLFYVLGQAQAFSHCGYALEDLFELEYLKTCREEASAAND